MEYEGHFRLLLECSLIDFHFRFYKLIFEIWICGVELQGKAGSFTLTKKYILYKFNERKGIKYEKNL